MPPSNSEDPEEAYNLVKELIEITENLLESSRTALEENMQEIAPRVLNEDYDDLFQIYQQITIMYNNFIRTEKNTKTAIYKSTDSGLRNILGNIAGHLENVVELALACELRK